MPSTPSLLRNTLIGEGLLDVPVIMIKLVIVSVYYLHISDPKWPTKEKFYS